MKNDIKYVHETDVHNSTAARKVVPLLIDLFKPQSVLDVGCGIGTWLSVFKENGVKEIFGVDGSYVNKDLLFSYIKPEEFKSLDISLPFDLNKTYDLAICLEVAEHLEEASAITFIENLSKHSSTIIFGAAVPDQGGQNHLNEKWPEYWINIFKTFGYHCYDVLRSRVWDDKDVDWWYKQNMFVFSTQTLDEYIPSESFLSIIHPTHFEQKVKYINDLNEKVYDLTNKVEKWESGQNGVRLSWANLLKSIKQKITNKK